MNKRIKLAALLTALTLSVTAFAACGKKDNGGGSSTASGNWERADFGDVFNTSYSYVDNTSGITATRLNDYTDYDFDNYFTGSAANQNVVALFSKIDSDGFGDYKVYNAMLSKQILSVTSSKDFTYNLNAIYFNGYVYAIKCNSYNLTTGESFDTIYSLDGKKLATDAHISMADVDSTESRGLFYIDDGNGSVYYDVNLRTGETSLHSEEKVDKGFVDFEIDYDYEGEKYDYVIDDASIFVYGKGGGKLLSKCVYEGIEDADVFLLDNETFLVQASRATDGEYDYLKAVSGSTVKYKLISYTFNPQTGKKTDVNLNFVVKSVANVLTDKLFNVTYKNSVENVASVSRISDDKQLIGKPRYIVLGNDASVNGVLDRYVPNQKSLPELLSDNLFKISAGGDYYLDGTGKVIGREIHNATNLNGPFVKTDYAVYNLKTIEAVYDLTQKDYTFSFPANYFAGDSVVLKKTNKKTNEAEYVMLCPNESAPKTLATIAGGAYNNAGTLSGNSKVLYIENHLSAGNVSFTYFNDDGKKLFEINSPTGGVSDYYQVGEYRDFVGIARTFEKDGDGNTFYAYYLFK